MRKERLTGEQIAEIEAALETVKYEDGDFALEFEIEGGLYVEAQGSIHTEGYVEDDSFHGTGAFVETSRDADLTLVVSRGSEEVEIGDAGREIEEYLTTL